MARNAGVQLLGAWSSPFSNRVELALKLKSVEYEFVEEEFYVKKSERLVKANPVYQKIPVLIHNEKPVCESLVIVEYIDEAWAGNGPSILPSDPYERAIARFWAGYLDNKWFPAMKELETASGDEAKATVVGKVFEGFALLEEVFVKFSKGKAFFGGDNVGYLDIALGCFLGWVKVAEIIGGGKLLDESRFPGLAAWAERFLSHDVAKDIVRDAPTILEFFGKVQAARAAAAKTAAE
ncbi:Glutathione S-transferase U17 [Sesamum alatum]|uniref:Glutathione S-transferase n=1 Tax=Sesamum alatum TaxID=300844 RepID=A0AAE2CPQ8_9LAMI|nr:Glutathione S-transferase U17 [Sesamum alatum]